jgi:hypothetical protein
LGSERPVLLSRGFNTKPQGVTGMFERLQQHRQDMPKTHANREGVSGQASHGTPAVPGQGLGGARHALLAERIRIKKALACAADGLFRERWEAELAPSMARALHLERTLRAIADATGHGHSGALQLGECLLGAMDMARANGDVSAAEVVAQECLALVELHCRTLLDVQSSGTAAAPLGQASFSNGAFES